MTNPFEILDSRLTKQEQLLKQILNQITKIGPVNKEGNMLDRTKLATRQVAADYLEVSVGTIDNLVRSKQLKSTRIGKSVRFRWQDLDDFLSKRSK